MKWTLKEDKWMLLNDMKNLAEEKKSKIVVRVFEEYNTGELRLYNNDDVERRGYQTILNELNTPPAVTKEPETDSSLKKVLESSL